MRRLAPFLVILFLAGCATFDPAPGLDAADKAYASLNAAVQSIVPRLKDAREAGLISAETDEQTIKPALRALRAFLVEAAEALKRKDLPAVQQAIGGAYAMLTVAESTLKEVGR